MNSDITERLLSLVIDQVIYENSGVLLKTKTGFARCFVFPFFSFVFFSLKEQKRIESHKEYLRNCQQIITSTAES